MNINDVKKLTGKLSVLYVEDYKEEREQTSILLEKFFKFVETSQDGEDALSRYEKNKFDILITDIKMPKKDGIELIKEIKKIDKDQTVVVISAHDDSKYLIPLINLDVDRFIIKPYDRKKFLFKLYKISQSILFEKQQNKQQRELENILNTIDSGVFVIDNGSILCVNNAAYKLTYTKNINQIQELFNTLSSRLIETENYIYGTSLEEIIEKTKDSSQNKLLIKTPSGNTTFLFNCRTLDEEKYVLSFNDITAFDNLDKYNQLTNLPNELYLSEVLDTFLESCDETALFLIQIRNFNGIKKFHGVNAGYEAIKKVAEILKYNFYNLNLEDEAHIASTGKNRFVIVSKASHIEVLQKLIHSLIEHSISKTEASSEKMREISLEANYKTLRFYDITTNALLETINKEFEKME